MTSTLIPVTTAGKTQGVPAGTACYKLHELRSLALTQKLRKGMKYK
jgi:hypothetical protein